MVLQDRAYVMVAQVNDAAPEQVVGVGGRRGILVIPGVARFLSGAGIQREPQHAGFRVRGYRVFTGQIREAQHDELGREPERDRGRPGRPADRAVDAPDLRAPVVYVQREGVDLHARARPCVPRGDGPLRWRVVEAGDLEAPILPAGLGDHVEHTVGAHDRMGAADVVVVVARPAQAPLHEGPTTGIRTRRVTDAEGTVYPGTRAVLSCYVGPDEVDQLVVAIGEPRMWDRRRAVQSRSDRGALQGDGQIGPAEHGDGGEEGRRGSLPGGVRQSDAIGYCARGAAEKDGPGCVEDHVGTSVRLARVAIDLGRSVLVLVGDAEVVREVAKADGHLALDGNARIVHGVKGNDDHASLRRAEPRLYEVGRSSRRQG